MCFRMSDTVSRIIENVSEYNLSKSFSSLSTLAPMPFAASVVALDAASDILKNTMESQIAPIANIKDAMDEINEKSSIALSPDSCGFIVNSYRLMMRLTNESKPPAEGGSA